MKKYLILLNLFIIFLFSTSRDCSAYSINGFTKDNSSSPISGATVILVVATSQTDISTYTKTSAGDGSFSFTGISSLSASMIGALKATWAFSPSTYTFQGIILFDQTANFWGTQNLTTYSISGHIMDNSVTPAPISGVTVTLFSLSSLTTAYTATTNSSGYYEFTGALQDLYVMAPAKDGWIFNPLSTSFGLASNQTQDFTGTPLYTVSGYTRDSSSSPIGGVNMVLQSLATSYAKLTDSNGFFEFQNVPADNYSLTPVENNWIFYPLLNTYTPLNSNLTGQNFTGFTTVPMYSITGYAMDESSVPIPSVTITLSGNKHIEALTDNAGAYYFLNLSSGNYVATPQKSNWNFSPPNNTYSNLAVSQSSQNFTGTQIIPNYSISGYVLTAASIAVAGISVNLTYDAGGEVIVSAITDGSGFYQFPNIATGTYLVIPSSPGYSFNPLLRNCSIIDANRSNQDFTAIIASATYFIKGYVKDSSSTSISGVKLTLSGDNSAEYTTSISGYYEFLNLAGGNFIITPLKQGCTFSPQDKHFSPLNSNLSDQNFTGGIEQPVVTPPEPVIDTVQPAKVHFGSNQAIRKKLKELKDKIERNKKEQ